MIHRELSHCLKGDFSIGNFWVAFWQCWCYCATNRLLMDTDRIEKKILLRATRNRVWRALADSTEFGTWFGVKFDGPFTPGGFLRGMLVTTKVNPEVAKVQKPHEGLPFDITIEQMEPERLFSFRWHPFAVDRSVDYSAEPATLVAFEIEEVPDGVMLTVTESGFEQIPLERRLKAFSANEQGWEIMIKVVGEYLVLAP
jgi:uncharacterized protein YndB with AHSA1/START domain